MRICNQIISLFERVVRCFNIVANMTAAGTDFLGPGMTQVARA